MSEPAHNPRSDERPVAVVAMPDKRNYLSHLIPADGSPFWATRMATTLCGHRTYFAGDGMTDRRKCQRCARKAVQP